MNKEKIFYGILILMVVLVLVGVGIDIYKGQKELSKLCQGKGLNYCSRNIVNCFDECEKLDKYYLKYDAYGGFGGSSECWCYDEWKNPIQIY